jgi:hypothetical protein
MCDLSSQPPANHQTVVTGGLPASPPADLDLDAIRARVDAATDGPWHRVDDFEEDGQAFSEVLGGGVPGSMSEHQILICQHFLNKRSGADAEFIAAARADVPVLLAEVERLRALVAARDTDETTLRTQLCTCGRLVTDHDKQWHAGYDQACEDAAAVTEGAGS